MVYQTFYSLVGAVEIVFNLTRFRRLLIINYCNDVVHKTDIHNGFTYICFYC